MKRIYFVNLNKSWLLVTVVILSIVCLCVVIFELIPFENSEINKWISVTGFLLQALFFSMMFWFRNYVQWNRKGAFIRMNSFLGKSVRFDEIRSTELNDQELTIIKTNGQKVMFDLTEIAASDT